jgi:hypothetical protein
MKEEFALSSPNEEISPPPPCGLMNEYIYFVKIGQPKLSERVTQVGSLFHLQIIGRNNI